MLSRISQWVLISLALTLSAAAQIPAGFHWVNFKTDPDTVASVAEALKAEEYSAIREIGVAGNSALVFTSLRGKDSPTPDIDFESVYDVSLKTGRVHKLLSGYELQIKNWLRFLAGGMEDLGIEYSDCFGCEPIVLFTVLHYTAEEGWRARWAIRGHKEQPGIVVLFTEDEEADQIFSVFSQPHRVAAAGVWYRSRDLNPVRATSELQIYRVNPESQRDEVITPKGSEADKWKWLLCRADHDSSALLQQGQSTSTCKQFLHTHPRP